MARRKKTRRARRNSAKVSSSTSALSHAGVSPSTTNSLATAHAVLSTSGRYPSGDVIGSGPMMSTGIHTISAPAVSITSTTTVPSGGLTGGSYQRISLASQPGLPTPQAKIYKELIDPQLWRLANGGDTMAMAELSRRNPAHGLQASSNLHAWKAGDWAVRIPHRGPVTFAKIIRITPGGTAVVDVYAEEGAGGQQQMTFQQRTVKPGRKVMSGQRYKIRADESFGGSKKLGDSVFRKWREPYYQTRNNPARSNPARSNPARSNPARSNPARRGPEFMMADDNNQWAEWALARQGVMHRGQGYGPGAWPVTRAQANPKKRGMSHHVGMAAGFISPDDPSRYVRDPTSFRSVRDAGRKRWIKEEQAREAERRGKKRVSKKPRSDTHLGTQSGDRSDILDEMIQAALRGSKARRNRSSLPSLGSGTRGGYTATERAALPDHWFLKPKTRRWPVGDPRHFEIAIQYMTAGRGNPLEYPKLIKRLALLWPVSQHAKLWQIYSRNRSTIAAKYGGKMPTSDQLRRS